jgi:hypothetical protein
VAARMGARRFRAADPHLALEGDRPDQRLYIARRDLRPGRIASPCHAQAEAIQLPADAPVAAELRQGWGSPPVCQLGVALCRIVPAPAGLPR